MREEQRGRVDGHSEVAGRGRARLKGSRNVSGGGGGSIDGGSVRMARTRAVAGRAARAAAPSAAVGRAVAVAGRRAWRQGGPRPRAPLEHHHRPRAWGVQPRRRVGGYGGHAGRGRAGLQGSRTVAGVGGGQQRRRVGGCGARADRGGAHLRSSRTVGGGVECSRVSGSVGEAAGRVAAAPASSAAAPSAGVGGAAASAGRRAWQKCGPRLRRPTGQPRRRRGWGVQQRRRVGGYGGKAEHGRKGVMLGSLGGGDVCRQRAFEEVGDAGL